MSGIVVEESIPAPKMEKITFPGKLLTTFDAIKSKLAVIPFYSTGLDADALTIARVESRNIHKMPYLFYIIMIKRDGVEAVYSIPPDTSSDMRRANILRSVCAILALVTDDYTVSQTELLQYADSTLDKLLAGITPSYSTLFNKYDGMLEEYRAFKRLNLELSSSNRNLTIQAAQLSAENKAQKAELEKLQKYSDESLMSMVEDWIEVHNNSIDIDLFSKTYSINAPRVEEILDKMVARGFLEVQS